MKNLAFLLISFFLVVSCQKEANFKILLPQYLQQNKASSIKIENINHSNIDKIAISIDQQPIQTLPFAASIQITIPDNVKLGEHIFNFDFIKGEKSLKKVDLPFNLFAGVKPKVLSYELVHSYPHDIEAFTQGLEFYKDTLYEGTGLYGASSLRKTDYKTGKIYQKIDLDKLYFGEGISILNNKVYQLTWQNGIGFIYNTNLQKIGDFKYGKSKEGWGLCNDGKSLYKSDGTEKIWILDPETLKETDFINVYTDRHKIVRINELEWVNGKIYTNVWQKNALAIINPKTGEVEGIVNLSDLHQKVTQHPELDVLNGIAYDKKTGHLFVTGKKWDKIFEIKIIP